MINAVSNYLQNQPLTSKDTNESEEVKSLDDKTSQEASAKEGLSDYKPSYRAVAVSALANEFNVHDLNNQELGKLEQKIQYYGLLQGRAIDALGLLRSTASSNENQEKENRLDAVAVLDKISHKYDDYEIGYQQRQAIGQIHSLFMNLSSARPAEQAV